VALLSPQPILFLAILFLDKILDVDRSIEW
jgi:hypothetical protein